MRLRSTRGPLGWILIIQIEAFLSYSAASTKLLREEKSRRGPGQDASAAGELSTIAFFSPPSLSNLRALLLRELN